MSAQEKIRIEVEIGPATVRVEAPPDKLEEAVKQVISAIKAVLPEISAEVGQVQRGERARRRMQPTCSELLRRLMEEGWFDTPRSLSEVVRELARRGYNYNSTAVSHSLLDLVRERSLSREGTPRRYVYFRSKREGGD
ncbi:MAG: hypothetical protein B6U65_01025 [Candidatus Wolframiiraptor sp. EX4484-121]|nr:MAG: hypothetical protein B6U65_01025 [Candidatus Wolframiiraptor sp. EX4484-121]